MVFNGRHFRVDGLQFQPRPLQQPRIPVWVVGGWKSRRSLDRALRWDGVIREPGVEVALLTEPCPASSATRAAHLVARERDALVEPAGWVWLLDSDCVVVRAGVLTDAIGAASACGAALVGERWWDSWHGCNRLALHSLLIDPTQVWQPGVRPFLDDGDPAYELERSCIEAGLSVLAFPFVSQGYVVHRGRGTLASVHARGEDTNRIYQWASTHHKAHFEDVPGAAETYARLNREFNDMVPIVDVEHLVPACDDLVPFSTSWLGG